MSLSVIETCAIIVTAMIFIKALPYRLTRHFEFGRRQDKLKESVDEISNSFSYLDTRLSQIELAFKKKKLRKKYLKKRK